MKTLLLIISLFILCSCNENEGNKTSNYTLMNAYELIKTKEFVDLTHSFEPGIPHWDGFPNEQRIVLYSHEEGEGTLGSGFFAEQFNIVGQWGTHVDPPVHFIKGLRTLDEITLDEMILPLVVIDVHEKVINNPDYILSLDDIKSWESKFGLIPKNSFVAMRTDWSKRWPDSKKMKNKDESGTYHYPGWGLDALKYLYEERSIIASGHEPIDTDPGIKTSKGDYSAEAYILGRNKYQIELLTNLDKVPESGAIVIISFPKPKGGSGFPARVFAILP